MDLPALARDTGAAPRRAVQKRSRPRTVRGSGGQLHCRLCGAPITDNSQRVEAQGAHVHTRQNPAGVVYCFGCFRAAPGCTAFGRPTAEHSWFAGCAWRIAACRGCGEHLGWQFQGVDCFFGLILDRLIERS